MAWPDSSWVLAIPGVKFLMALFAPAAWVFSQHKVRFLITFLAPLIALYGVLFMLGADLTMPFRMQLNYQTSGNLPFFLGLLGLDAASPLVQRLFDLILLSSLAIIFLIHVSQTRTGETRWLIHMCSIVGLTFMFFSKKSYTTYLVLFYFPLCLSVARNSFSAAVSRAIRHLQSGRDNRAKSALSLGAEFLDYQNSISGFLVAGTSEPLYTSA
jgi:hypothetical protein